VTKNHIYWVYKVTLPTILIFEIFQIFRTKIPGFRAKKCRKNKKKKNAGALPVRNLNPDITKIWKYLVPVNYRLWTTNYRIPDKICPSASSYLSKSPATLYKGVAKTKKCEYEERINQVEHGSFTPMIMTSSGSMCNEMQLPFRLEI